MTCIQSLNLGINKNIHMDIGIAMATKTLSIIMHMFYDERMLWGRCFDHVIIESDADIEMKVGVNQFSWRGDQSRWSQSRCLFLSLTHTVFLSRPASRHHSFPPYFYTPWLHNHHHLNLPLTSTTMTSQVRSRTLKPLSTIYVPICNPKDVNNSKIFSKSLLILKMDLERLLTIERMFRK